MIRFTIPGNHKNPQGNPKPYLRTTQRGKYGDAYNDYLDWKLYVLQCALEAGVWKQIQKLKTEAKLFSPYDRKIRLDVIMYLVGQVHGDPENVRKGIQDALFPPKKATDIEDEYLDDKHVSGSVNFFYVEEQAPYTVVELQRITTGAKLLWDLK